MEHPTFCRVEYWSDVKQDWYTGHAGINLMNPAAYALKLGKNGCLARIVCVDSGETVYSEGADLLSKRVLSRNEEIEIAICYLADIPVKTICAHYAVHRMTIHRVLTRLGIETERGKKTTS